MIQPFLEPFGHNLGRKSSFKKAIPAHGRANISLGTKSALANWTVLGLGILPHRNGPTFRAKTDLSDLECTQLFFLCATHFGKRTFKTLLESVVLICCEKVTTANLHKAGLIFRE